jgi:hypothetical protein
MIDAPVRRDGKDVRWMELRDERGRLMAKVEPRAGLLEVRRDGASAVFDLRDYLDLLRERLER